MPETAVRLRPDPDTPLTLEAFQKSSDVQVRKAYEALKKEVR